MVTTQRDGHSRSTLPASEQKTVLFHLLWYAETLRDRISELRAYIDGLAPLELAYAIACSLADDLRAQRDRTLSLR